MVALCTLLLTAAEANAADRAARLQGNVQSAGAPLAGYKVSLYANFIDHGPAWKLLGSNTTNDAGHFDIAYSLPPGLVDDASILFVQAERGRAMLASAIGLGSSAPAQVVVNERTTVATGNAFARFVDDRKIGGNTYGMINALPMAANLANPQTGAVGVVLASTPNGNETSTLPTFKETDFLIDLEAPPGTSLPEMDRVTAQASHEVRAVPGVRDVGAHVGRAITGDQVSNPNGSELWVSLSSTADYDDTLAAVRRAIKGYPGIESDVKTYSQAKFGDLQTGTDEPVVVRVYGPELNVLRTQTEAVTKAMAGTRGISDLHAEMPTQEPTIQVEVNLDAAKAAGIKPGDVRRAAAVLVSGVTAGSLFEEQKVFDVVVWGTPATRQDVTAVRNLLIDTPNGGQVRLGDVARVDVQPSPNVIQRDAVSRYVDVTAQVRGRSRSAVLADVKDRLQGVKFPLEYRYELVSNFADRGAIEHRLVLLGIGIAIGTFLLLQAAFANWRLAVLHFVTLPLALVGGTLVILIGGGTIELGSVAGLLAVFAIAVRNGVVLLQRFQRLEGGEGNGLGRDLVVQGARDRLAPILLTAGGTAAFFVPFALLGDLPGHEIVSPMASAGLGGLVTSTIVSLFLLPALYHRFAYGKASMDDLDLRDLWVETAQPPAPPVAIDLTGNGDGDGNGHRVPSEVGAPSEALEAWPS